MEKREDGWFFLDGGPHGRRPERGPGDLLMHNGVEPQATRFQIQDISGLHR